MRRSFLYTVLVGASVAVCGPALAVELVYAMPSNHYDELNAKLILTGYQEVRVVDKVAHYIVAFDSDGSEVRMLVDPKTHKILSSTYVHHVDE